MTTSEMINKVIQGDCLEVLKTFPDESINCCMTSPPYWALRDYGVDGQLGLEDTFQQYINKLCDIFDEVKRVLRKDGTLWVNIADTYFGGGNNRGNNSPIYDKQKSNRGANGQVQQDWSKINFKHKSLCNIPARFSIEMQNRGWILRNVIIWHKPNCMPSSVKDRFTVDFEYLYFFVKNKKYWFETQYEPTALSTITRGQYGWRGREIEGIGRNQPQATEKMGDRWCNPSGRNKRTVWTITTKPFKEAHFATYPEALCKTPIKAGCPEFVCNKCGKPREKIFKSNRNIEEEKQRVGEKNSNTSSRYKSEGKILTNDQTTGMQHRDIGPNGEVGMYNKTEFTGKYTDCNCNAGFSGGIVLDPFFGAGTTGLVAMKQNKNFIGIELSEEYCKIAEARIEKAKEELRKCNKGTKIF